VKKNRIAQKNTIDDKKGCHLVFYFFILALLGMLLVLFIKIKYFLNGTPTW